MHPRIRALRKEHNFTQRQVARYLYISQSVYSCYQRGQREIPLLVAKRLAYYYNVSIDYLLEEDK